MEWFIATKTGRSVSAAILVALTTLLCWFGFASHYEKVGRDKCQAEYAKAQRDADRQQDQTNRKNDATGRAIGKESEKAEEKIHADTTKQQQKTDKEIENAYRNPKPTAPIALGSCVHPVDDRVQDVISAAVDRANAP